MADTSTIEEQVPEVEHIEIFPALYVDRETLLTMKDCTEEIRETVTRLRAVLARARDARNQATAALDAHPASAAFDLDLSALIPDHDDLEDAVLSIGDLLGEWEKAEPSFEPEVNHG